MIASRDLPRADPHGRSSAALLVIGTGIGMAGGFAVLFSATFGVFLKPIGQDLGWERSQVSVITMMGFLGYAFGSPLLGVLSAKLGMRLLLISGIVLFAASLAALGHLPPDLPAYALCSLVIGFSGAITAPPGYVLILSRHFDRRFGLAIGCAMIGLGVGVAVIPAVAQAFIAMLGWRNAYAALGTLAIAFGSMAILMGAGRSATLVVAAPERSVEPEISGVTLAEALQSWRFWLIGITTLVVGIAGFGGAAHMVAVLTDHGIDPAVAARVAGLGGVGIMVGRTAAAALMDRIFAPYVVLICCLLGALGLLMIDLVPAGHVAIAGVGALLTGLLVGSEGDAMPFLTRRYFGMAAFGSVFGCIVGLAAIGGMLGPLVFGLSFDTTGSYAIILKVAALAAAASGLSLLALGPYRFGPDPA